MFPRMCSLLHTVMENVKGSILALVLGSEPKLRRIRKPKDPHAEVGSVGELAQVHIRSIVFATFPSHNQCGSIQQAQEQAAHG